MKASSLLLAFLYLVELFNYIYYNMSCKKRKGSKLHMMKMIVKRIKRATLADKISWIFGAVALLFFTWFIASFIEVQIHNCTMLSTEPYQYSSWNLFINLIKWFGKA